MQNFDIVKEWEEAKITAFDFLSKQQILRQLNQKSQYSTMEESAKKRTSLAQQMQNSLQTILIDLISSKVNYWKIITPVFKSSKQPEILSPILKPHYHKTQLQTHNNPPVKTIATYAEMDGYYDVMASQKTQFSNVDKIKGFARKIERFSEKVPSYTGWRWIFTWATLGPLLVLQPVAIILVVLAWIAFFISRKIRFWSFKKKVVLDYQNNINLWEDNLNQELHLLNAEVDKNNEIIIKNWKNAQQEATEKWEIEQKTTTEAHELKNTQIEKLRQGCISCDKESIIGYCNVVLTCHQSFDFFPNKFECDYIEDTKTLIVDYALPEPSDIPTLKEVKFVKTTNSFKETHISQSAINKLYDGVVYQLTLAKIAVLFSADEANAIDSIVFNGWVESIDKGTGHKINACILSLHVTKSDLQEVNLHNVDPKECFKRFKGVGSSQLYGITPIPPIMKINTQDKRFVESYEVANTLDDSINLATMDWEDFEHLVREVFEKKFSKDGIQVKVTQSSRDKGVDAIAFDPDPLRGGKIIIQAKRYTNVVGVSAVRDLYGTFHNEGAMKAILVTTSNFGHDAYDFVKGKPLTLVSGGELLTLLEDCGYKARIDILLPQYNR